jgi:flagellar biosynthetic protein FliR
MVLEGLAASLQTIPPGTLPGFHGGASVALATVGSLFGDALQVAAPVSVAVTITNFAMAILSRAVPQLNAMAMSFAVSIAVGLVMFGAALPMVAKVVGRWVGAMPAGIQGMVGAFARP